MVSIKESLSVLGEHRYSDRIEPCVLVRCKTAPHALADALFRPVLGVLFQQRPEGAGKLLGGSMSN